MNADNGLIVYLAGPIANQPLWAAREWRRRLIDGVLHVIPEGLPVAFFDPANAFSLSDAGMLHPGLVSRVQLDVDDAALRTSDVVVAQMLEGVESNGTDHEVRWAVSLGKPLIVFGGLQHRLRGRIQGILRTTDLHVDNLAEHGKLRFVATLADATRALADQLDGTKAIMRELAADVR